MDKIFVESVRSKVSQANVDGSIKVAVLEFIRNNGGIAETYEIDMGVADILGFSSEEIKITDEGNNNSILFTRLGFTRLELKLDSILENPENGIWILSEKGETLDIDILKKQHINSKKTLKDRKNDALKEMSNYYKTNKDSFSESMKNKLKKYRDTIIEMLMNGENVKNVFNVVLSF